MKFHRNVIQSPQLIKCQKSFLENYQSGDLGSSFYFNAQKRHLKILKAHFTITK